MEENKPNEEEICPECGSSIVRVGNLEVCSICGLVINNDIIVSQTERAYTQEEKKEIFHTELTNPLLANKGLGAEIDKSNKDLNPAQRKNAFYLRKTEKFQKSRENLERNLSIANSEIGRICGNLNLPRTVIEEAISLYKKVAEKGLCMGRTIDSFVGAAIYAASKIGKFPRSLNEIVPFSKLSLSQNFGSSYKEDILRKRKAKTKILRSYLLIHENFGLTIPILEEKDYAALCARLFENHKDYEDKQINLEYFILEKLDIIKESGYSLGKNPNTLIAGLAYYWARLNNIKFLTQYHITEQLKITEPSLRDKSKYFRNMFLIPDMCLKLFENQENLESIVSEEMESKVEKLESWISQKIKQLKKTKVLERVKYPLGEHSICLIGVLSCVWAKKNLGKDSFLTVNYFVDKFGISKGVLSAVNKYLSKPEITKILYKDK